ncbi:MAG: Rne/Rng family ribonuclease [Aeriscardovia sp.]|nr:Rne/Rng family ribonuclease [Aeriscardovia sp.]
MQLFGSAQKRKITSKLQKRRGILSKVGEIRVFVASRNFSSFDQEETEGAAPNSPSPAPPRSIPTSCAPKTPKKDKKLLIKSRGGHVQASVLEDGILMEHYASGITDTSVGNIYAGKICGVLPGIGSAFVDIGEEKAGILKLPSLNNRNGQRLRYGDPVLVQVTKDPRGHKGPDLSSKISLSGRFLVFMPFANVVGASSKLEGRERARLRKMLREILPQGEGAIARTAAAGCSEESLESDYEALKKRWQEIEMQYARSATTGRYPALLKSDSDLALKLTRDVFNDSFTALQVQGRDFEKVRSYVGETNPELLAKVQKWDLALEKEDIFDHYGIEDQLDRGLERIVELPNGGTLVIDKTEALTAIDVNSAKFSARSAEMENTATQCNIEAAKEIGRQLRLRDIGGMVIVDFINMQLESDKQLVLSTLQKSMEGDRSKHAIEGMSSLGLVEITRKKLGQGLVESFSHECENCHGRGLIISREPVKAAGTQEQPEPQV